MICDANGHISGAVDVFGNRNIRYVSDAQGIVLVRDEVTGMTIGPNYRYGAYEGNPGSDTNKIERFYYVDGIAVGGVGNDGPSRVDYVQSMANRNKPQGNYANWKPVSSADFDQNYEPISPTYPGSVAGSYTVRNGDTLQSIALTVWGDSAMWYLIADANGLMSGQQLDPNMVLIIPNKVTNIHNNAGTYRPYNPGEAIGDLNPTIPAAPLPKPKKKGCGGFATIIVAAIAIMATIYTAGALAGPSAALAVGGGTTAASTFATGVAVLGGSAGLSAGAGFAIGLAAGAAGSVAGQIAGNALGVQDGFSWSAVAAGAIGAGLGASTAFGGLLGKVPGGPFGQAIAGNLVNQSVGIITGAQKGFSWSSVAASAVAAPITSSINQSIKGSDFAKINPLNAGIAGAVAGITTTTVNELTRVAISGGKISWANVAIGGVQGGIYGYGEGLSNQRLTLQAIAKKLGVLDSNYRRLFTDQDATIYENVDQGMNNLAFRKIFGDDPNHFVIGAFLDGTWNKRGEGGLANIQAGIDSTNVGLLEWMSERGDTNYLTKYFPGVGTDWYTKYVGGGTGFGMLNTVNAAYDWAVSQVNQIYSQNHEATFDFLGVGFSRGAVEIRVLVNMIDERGIPDISTRFEVLKSGLTGEKETRYKNYIIEPKQANLNAVIFDSVSTGFGDFYNINLPERAQVYHPIARDEMRGLFPSAPLTQSGVDLSSTWYQPVLPGDHSDIGNNHDRGGLGDWNLKLAHKFMTEVLGLPMQKIPDAYTPVRSNMWIHNMSDRNPSNSFVRGLAPRYTPQVPNPVIQMLGR